MRREARPGPAKDTDEYIATAPTGAQAHLRQLRKAIRAAAPKAVEAISYRVPVFKYEGILVGFAAFKDHYSFFVMSPATMKEFRNELKKYDVAKATIRVPMGTPLPSRLVKKLVKARVRENEERARKRAERKSKRRRAEKSR